MIVEKVPGKPGLFSSNRAFNMGFNKTFNKTVSLERPLFKQPDPVLLIEKKPYLEYYSEGILFLPFLQGGH